MPPTTPREPSPTFPSMVGLTGHVLVVDDDAKNRTLIADWLSANGHHITTATDGVAALQAVALKVPDAILLDVMMPGLDGFAVCEQLKADQATAFVPIIMMTALHEREDRLRGMRAGANDFLQKPIDLPYVLLRVRNAIHRKRLHDEVEAKLKEIRRQEQLRESLLHMIVHDLRTPLAGLEGYLQLLQMSAGPKLDERPAHYLNQSLSAAHKLAHHIDLLLDIHRMEDGRLPVQFVEHDLAAVVLKALEPLRPLIGKRRLKVDQPSSAVPAIGDPGLIERVVSNLIGNALAFTSSSDGHLAVRIFRQGERARVEITDNGPGIEPAHQQAIFDKFFQVGDNTRRRSSGLGLAFCKLALDAQKGAIGVISEPGIGSCFWFELPAT